MRAGRAADPARLPSAYWRQWGATAVSNTGDGMNLAAMPLLANSLTDDARMIAAVTFAASLPWLIFSLPIGVWIDRWDRQHTMVIANVVRAALFAVIAVGAATGRLGIEGLLVILVGVGIGEVLFDSTAQAFLPSIVQPEQLPRANGILYATEVVGNGFVGLPIGAWLFVAMIGLPFGINAASFLLAAALIASIRFAPGSAPTSSKLPSPFRTELSDGFRWLFASPLLLSLAMLLAAVNLGLHFGYAVFVKFAAEELGVSERGYGLLLAVMALGAVAGGLLGDRFAERLGSSSALLGAYFAFGMCQIAMGLATSVWMVALIAAAEGMATTVWNVISVSLRQRLIPKHLFGRVNGIFRWLGTGSVAIGALIGGQLAYHVDIRAPFIAGGVVTLVALVVGAWPVRPAALARAEALAAA